MKLLSARRILATAALAAGVLFTTCGLDEDYYLDPIPESNIRWESSNTIVSIQLPNIDTSATGTPYFTGFRLYYRIYISDSTELSTIRPTDISGNTERFMTPISDALWYNFRTLYQYTDTTGTNINTSNMANVLTGQRFYELELQGANINSVLSASALGDTISFDSSGTLPVPGYSLPYPPVLQLGADRYVLLRSTGEGKFTPEPNRYFINTKELCDSEKIDPGKNADVANINARAADNGRYTFAAFYILVAGINENNFTPIYSAPTFIGVLKLPGAPQYPQ